MSDSFRACKLRPGCGWLLHSVNLDCKYSKPGVVESQWRVARDCRSIRKRQIRILPRSKSAKQERSRRVQLRRVTGVERSRRLEHAARRTAVLRRPGLVSARIQLSKASRQAGVRL